MNPTIPDHLLTAILFVVLPALSVLDYRRLLSRLDAGSLTARLSFYRLTIVWLWGLALAVVALWLWYGRSFLDIGLGLETGRGFWVGLVLTVLVCGLYAALPVGLRRDPEKLRQVAVQFEPTMPMMPHTDQEARVFTAVSITAGICEEIVYRGYLMLYVTAILGVESLWPAAFLSSLAFGLAHLYQGPRGGVRAGVFGLAMAGLYVLTGSVWLPMIAHAVVDIVLGTVGRSAITAADQGTRRL